MSVSERKAPARSGGLAKLLGALVSGRELSQTGWLVLLLVYLLAPIAYGLLVEPWPALWAGWKAVLTSPGMLLSDYLEIGGLGAALVNAGLVGLTGLLLVYLSGVLLSGPTVAAILTLAGFGLFGKNVWNIWPVMLGVALFARVVRRPFKSYILVALFGTALSPLVTQVAYGLDLPVLPGLLLGVLAGVAVGFMLPPLAVYMLRLHQGYNIYNVGLTCGFLGLFVKALLEAFGLPASPLPHWSEAYSETLGTLLLVYVAFLLAVGLLVSRFVSGKKLKDGLGMRALVKEVGALPTDLVERHGAGPALINAGLVGLIGWGYIALVGGTYNGPTLGGVLTMVGFATFGKHPLNILPLMLGVYGASRAMVWQPADAGPLLAALFSTTLAPLSGRFGPLAGLLAGAVHLALVMRTAAWFGGLNLYNNGFAGGLTATLFVSLITWWSSWREDHARGPGGRAHEEN
jgi:hypothetical protein